MGILGDPIEILGRFLVILEGFLKTRQSKTKQSKQKKHKLMNQLMQLYLIIRVNLGLISNGSLMKCNVIFVAGGVLRRNAPEGCLGGRLRRGIPKDPPGLPAIVGWSMDYGIL